MECKPGTWLKKEKNDNSNQGNNLIIIIIIIIIMIIILMMMVMTMMMMMMMMMMMIRIMIRRRIFNHMICLKNIYIIYLKRKKVLHCWNMTAKGNINSYGKCVCPDTFVRLIILSNKVRRY